MPRESSLTRLLPALGWLRQYRRPDFGADLLAGLITAVLLIPQAVAFAALAGLPPQAGLYASIIPPLIYALFASSRTLSVGPVSLAALLVASALGGSGHAPGEAAYLRDALVLAALSGLILLGMGIARLGKLVSLLSHPVLAGFTSAAAIVIMVSQLPNLTGITLPRGEQLFGALAHAWSQRDQLLPLTSLVGVASLVLLLLGKAPLEGALRRLGLPRTRAQLISRGTPLLVLGLIIVLAARLELERHGVATVGSIPAGLPTLNLEFLVAPGWFELLPAALLIAVIGYVESISVAKVLAYRRRQRVAPNQELIALGLANVGAAVSSGMPVAGSLNRSMANFGAGARTQLAGVVASLAVVGAALFLTPWFAHLPHATLAALIIVSVLPLLDFRTLRSTWRVDKADFAAMTGTFAGVLALGLEIGLAVGVALSLAIHIWRTGQPHVAVVGRIAGSQHYRNVQRHRVETWPELLLVRVDESLYFANTDFVEGFVADALSEQPQARHLVLICSAVNNIDHSALESLENLALSLREAGVTLHLAEVKGPVMDRLRRSELPRLLRPGRVFLSTEEAVRELTAGD